MKPIFYLKAACIFVAGACGTVVGATQNMPETNAGWVLLGIGALGAGCTALGAYLSQASTTDQP